MLLCDRIILVLGSLCCRHKTPSNGYSECSTPISKNNKRAGKERKSEGEDERTRKQVGTRIYPDMI